MKLQIISPDPLKILESTKWVLDTAQFVSISASRIKKAAENIIPYLERKNDALGEGFNVFESFEENAQLVLIEDSVNYCFWSELNVPRWEVEFPRNQFTQGGWFGLQRCFERALAENIPILDAAYLKDISFEDTGYLFRSANEHEIPLIEERRDCLRETGKVLFEKYDGKFINVINSTLFDAVELTDRIRNDFPSFRDTALLNKKDVTFLKRAQIVANDIAYISDKNNQINLKNLDQLTAFADYKIPQILRFLEVITYRKELAQAVDGGVHISKGSREEVEIRSATVWGVELIRQALHGQYSSAQIDNALWSLSQSQAGMKTYHRTKTTCY